jgi:hypothetical protein
LQQLRSSLDAGEHHSPLLLIQRIHDTFAALMLCGTSDLLDFSSFLAAESLSTNIYKHAIEIHLLSFRSCILVYPLHVMLMVKKYIHSMSNCYALNMNNHF